MMVRGIRGATTVAENTEQQILQATSELLESIVARNQVNPSDISSVFVTVTPDVNATFPARAIRYMSGWELVPLMCSQEMDVPNGLPKCIRLMILINTEKSQADMQHVYLRDAVALRPDLVQEHES